MKLDCILLYGAGDKKPLVDLIDVGIWESLALDPVVIYWDAESSEVVRAKLPDEVLIVCADTDISATLEQLGHKPDIKAHVI